MFSVFLLKLLWENPPFLMHHFIFICLVVYRAFRQHGSLKSELPLITPAPDCLLITSQHVTVNKEKVPVSTCVGSVWVFFQ
jgi:hypothetical protein